MFWHFYCFLIINTSKGVNGERYRAASSARQKNKFCPNYFGAFTQNFLEIERSDAQIHDFSEFLLTQQFHLHLSGVTSDPDLPGDVWSQNSLKFICQSSSQGDEVPGFPEDYRERECSLIHSASRSAVWYCVLFSLYTEHLGTTLNIRQV